ncbi:hypothetical protein BESB_052730 [Besnoitia besnoiti]|uniref:Uncharacterized protein n=1 Tax=Besnoitia besnoiti TaxID=94643 RepID=A0A2A9MJQ6_BESBE|nr:hypothetical protein BESB_052730 [Besnoitia besnoiti]PFH35622.1 hypothetical protein BESB_052730 [Besnoitia besnoiti]
MTETTGKKMTSSAPAPKSSRGFDCMSQIRVFEESVARELKHLKVFQNYQLNPSHVPVITEKVNLHDPNEKIVSHPAYAEIARKVQQHLEPTIKKLSFSETSSQEVGWLVLKELEKGTKWRTDGSTTKLLRPNSELYWNAPHRPCDITNYGELYAKQMHQNMFQKRDRPETETSAS